MLMGLQEGQEKMSKSDPDSAIFMEDTPEDVKRKIRKAYCPPGVVPGNPCLDWTKHILFGKFPEGITVKRNADNGGDKCVPLAACQTHRDLPAVGISAFSCPCNHSNVCCLRPGQCYTECSTACYFTRVALPHRPLSLCLPSILLRARFVVPRPRLQAVHQVRGPGGGLRSRHAPPGRPQGHAHRLPQCVRRPHTADDRNYQALLLHVPAYLNLTLFSHERLSNHASSFCYFCVAARLPVSSKCSILQPIRDHFASGEPKALLEQVKKFRITR